MWTTLKLIIVKRLGYFFLKWQNSIPLKYSRKKFVSLRVKKFSRDYWLLTPVTATIIWKWNVLENPLLSTTKSIVKDSFSKKPFDWPIVTLLESIINGNAHARLCENHSSDEVKETKNWKRWVKIEKQERIQNWAFEKVNEILWLQKKK